MILPFIIIIIADSTGTATESKQPHQAEKGKNKRKERARITLNEKVAIIARVEGGVSMAAISREYGVDRSAVSKMLKKKAEILN